MEDDYGSNVYAKLEKNCLLYGVSALECSLWRDFGIRDSLRIRMREFYLSFLERCPL